MGQYLDVIHKAADHYEAAQGKRPEHVVLSPHLYEHVRWETDPVAGDVTMLFGMKVVQAPATTEGRLSFDLT